MCSRRAEEMVSRRSPPGGPTASFPSCLALTSVSKSNTQGDSSLFSIFSKYIKKFISYKNNKHTTHLLSLHYFIISFDAQVLIVIQIIEYLNIFELKILLLA